ncbi:MAG: DNA methyltransferase [Ignavibacteria bacterium]|jgi:site-specific DNA-methyltransferase (adenine-specific)|nr:DNA methyltransferase [Ignavibacteria bacterium]MDH7526679.1 DNA methyltransferase [Ignavibacteria bacterium]
MKIPAPRNRTIRLTKDEINELKKNLIHLDTQVLPSAIENKIINQDLFDVIDKLPQNFVDLLFIDPPYNLDKNFSVNSKSKNYFKALKPEEYKEWFESWFARLLKILKPNASVYICSDWRSTYLIQDVAQKYLKVQNRITWEREKGRGAKSNWKNCSEDILFCTVSDNFVFNADKVKLKRKVIAPYRDENGNPKDWKDGFRLTYPSNLWTDISVPFWSMPENTDHPTQKPEKLLAKIILASSNEGDFIFDPFLGSGTTAVVAKKLNRKFSGVEIDEYYCCIAEKRLKLAEEDKSIQGYEDGVFWERNTLNLIRKNKNGNS